MEEPKTYLNAKDKCIVCFEEPKKWENGQEIELIEHHVSYFPQIIAYVHYECHAKIHDLNNPLSHLIQYAEGDSRKFYDERTQNQPTICGECGAPVTKHYRLCRLNKEKRNEH